jgi:hypothetical protein
MNSHTAVASPGVNEASRTVDAVTDAAGTATRQSQLHCRFADVQKHKVFYREGGPKDAPLVLLLHGFPTSSHMFPRMGTHMRKASAQP